MGVSGEWSDGTFVQTYASIRDPITKLYSSFTCNSEFNTGANYAKTKVVRSFEGNTPLKSSRVTAGKWNNITVDDMLSEEKETWSLV